MRAPGCMVIQGGVLEAQEFWTQHQEDTDEGKTAGFEENKPGDSQAAASQGQGWRRLSSPVHDSEIEDPGQRRLCYTLDSSGHSHHRIPG